LRTQWNRSFISTEHIDHLRDISASLMELGIGEHYTGLDPDRHASLRVAESATV